MTETEKYLCKFRQLESEKMKNQNDLADAIEEYSEQYNRTIGSTNFDAIRTSNTNIKFDPVAQTVEAMLDVFKVKMDKLREKQAKIIEKQKKITDIVDSCDLNFYEASYINLRYFKGYKSWQTANKLKYSERQTKRFRVTALAKIERKLKNGPTCP